MSSSCARTDTSSPAAIEKAPASSPASPARRTVAAGGFAPATPSTSDTFVNRPSPAPRTAARTPLAPTSRWRPRVGIAHRWSARRELTSRERVILSTSRRDLFAHGDGSFDDETREGDARAQAELRIDAVQVRTDRAVRHAQQLADLLVGMPLCDEFGDS